MSKTPLLWHSLSLTQKKIKYQDFPKYCTFTNNSWHWRKVLPKKNEVARTIGRINAVSPGQGERYYLRMMLTHTTGATSFDDLKRVKGELFNTFKEACKAMGLLEDDTEWENALQEVTDFGSAQQIRATFAVLLQFCHPTNPLALYNKFKEKMSEDFIYHEIKKGKLSKSQLDMKWISNEVLRNIDQQLCEMGGSLSDHKEMPQPKELTPDEKLARTFAEEYFCPDAMKEVVCNLKPHLNHGQAILCEEIYQAVHGENVKKAFVVCSPGGFGKTFAFQILAAQVRSEGGIVLNVASTGLAAQNLLGGRTAHSRFKIPIPIQEDSTCSIKAQSDSSKTN